MFTKLALISPIVAPEMLLIAPPAPTSVPVAITVFPLKVVSSIVVILPVPLFTTAPPLTAPVVAVALLFIK